VTRVGYRDPSALSDSYALGDQQVTLGNLDNLMEQLVAEADG
jgi:hypothetical protein